MALKVKNSRAIALTGALDFTDQTGKYQRKVSNKFLANTFALSDVTEANEKYVKPIREKWIEEEKIDKADFQDETKAKELENRFDIVLLENEEYQKWLEQESSIEFTTITLEEISTSDFKSSVIKLLAPEILVKPTPKKKIKASL